MDPKEKRKYDDLPEEEKKAIEDKKIADEEDRLRRYNIPCTITDNEDGTYTVTYKSEE